MRFRKLRIAFSVACGIACLLLIGMWVRSYWNLDQVYCQYPGLRFGFRIASLRGGAYIELRDYDSTSGVLRTRHGELSNGVAILNSDGNYVSNWFLYVFDRESAYVGCIAGELNR
jgi:hypothetical protein